MANNLSSTEKALMILLAFTPHNQPLGTLELSKKLNIHKSTVSRLLHLLADNGFLQQNPDTKKYMLGRRAAEIGNAVLRSFNDEVVAVAKPFLHELSETVGESVALEIVSGNSVHLAYHVEGRGHIRFSFQLGEQVPMHVAAGAKAIIAHRPPEFADLHLKGDLKPFTENTIVSEKEFRALLEEIRDTGVAFDNGERYEDTRAVAAPILDRKGVAVAAVIIAGPAFRLTPDFLRSVIEPLKRTAAKISERLFP